jgi:hypothetical protein
MAGAGVPISRIVPINNTGRGCCCTTASRFYPSKATPFGHFSPEATIVIHKGVIRRKELKNGYYLMI